MWPAVLSLTVDMDDTPARVHVPLQDPNQQYLLQCFKDLQQSSRRPLIALDFGCGDGDLVGEARRAGFEFFGAEAYYGRSEYEAESLARTDPDAAPCILRIGKDGRVPVVDCYFDFVCSNQVFEHLRDLRSVVGELARITRPDGVHVHVVPTLEQWVDGHTGVWFVHKIPRGNLRRLLAAAFHRLRWVNFWKPDVSFEAWWSVFDTFLADDTFYRSWGDIRWSLTQFFTIRHRGPEKFAWMLQRTPSRRRSNSWRAIRWLWRLVPEPIAWRLLLHRSGVTVELRARTH